MLGSVGWKKKGTHMLMACFAMVMKYFHPKIDLSLFTVEKNKEKRENVF